MYFYSLIDLTATLDQHLHVKTIVLVFAVMNAIMIIGFPYYAGRGKWGASVRWWAFGTVISPIAPLLAWGLPLIPGTWPVIIGTLLYFINNYCQMAGIRAHLGYKITYLGGFFMLFLGLFVIITGFFVEPMIYLILWSVTLMMSIIYTSGSISKLIINHDAYQSSRWRTLFWLSIYEVFEVVMLAWMLLSMPNGLPKNFNWFYFLIILYLIHVMIRNSMYFFIFIDDLQKTSRLSKADLKQKTHELAEMIHNLGCAIIVFDSKGQILMTNEVARTFLVQLHWQGESELAWRSWQFYLNPETEPVQLEQTPLMAPWDNKQTIANIVLSLSHKKGRLLSGIFNAYPILNEQQEVEKVVMSFIDITALKDTQQQHKQLQQRLAESSRMRAVGTLAMGIAHDFNNILTVFIGHLGLLEEKFKQQEAYQQIKTMQSSARRGRELVRQILTFGRPPELHLAVCDAKAILEKSIEILQADPELPQGCHITLLIHEPIPPLYGDAAQITQILQHLGRNAIEALEQGEGVIRFEINSIEAHHASVPLTMQGYCVQAAITHVVRYVVQDSGCGFNEATKARLFEPFFTTKAVGKGSGLGLSVVHNLVEAHHGCVLVESEVGQGSRFTVLLMAANTAILKASKATHSNSTSSSTRLTYSNHLPQTTSNVSPLLATEQLPFVLYVDDEVQIARLVRSLLRRSGFACEIATSKADAMLYLKQHHEVEVLITDYRMPDADGLCLAEEALQHNPKLRVILLSGYVDEVLVRQGLALGIKRVLLKSEEIERLGHLIHEVSM